MRVLLLLESKLKLICLKLCKIFNKLYKNLA